MDTRSRGSLDPFAAASIYYGQDSRLKLDRSRDRLSTFSTNHDRARLGYLEDSPGLDRKRRSSLGQFSVHNTSRHYLLTTSLKI